MDRSRKEYFKEYNKSRPYRNREWSSIHKKEKTRPAYHLLRCARNRKYKHPHLVCSLKEEDINVPSVCPVLCVPISFENELDYRPTIDRIDNKRAYEKGNIMVLSHKANRMKNNATNEELVAFAIWVLKSYSPEHLANPTPVSSPVLHHSQIQLATDHSNPSQQLYQHDEATPRQHLPQQESAAHSEASVERDYKNGQRPQDAVSRTNHTTWRGEGHLGDPGDPEYWAWYGPDGKPERVWCRDGKFEGSSG